MISRRDFGRNRKGIGTVFGMVFFILIVMIVIASLMVILNQNTGLEQTTIQAKQLDLDRYTELETVSINNPETAVLNNVVYVSCSVSDNGTLPVELDRFWIRDVNTGTVNNIAVTPSVTLQPGASTYYFNYLSIAGSSYSDQFIIWFVTARGNSISDYPNINKFNGIMLSGSFPGVADMNSTYQTNSTPMQLSLVTTQPNQLIYVVVSYDDGNTLYTPTSSPSLTWALRDASQTTATAPYSGDSILKTFYAIDSSVGLVTISIHSTADELSDYYCSALAFAISNVNTTSPFDGPPLGQGPQTSIGESTTVQDTITTHYANDMIIGALGIDNLNPSITPGAGFAQIMPVQSSYGASGEDNAMPRSVWSEWAIMKTPVKNLSVNCSFTSSENWAVILDAVRLVVVAPPSPVVLSPTIGTTGQVVTVSGTGFAANSQLQALFDATPIPFSFTTDASGNIPSGATFTVPQGVTPGSHLITIYDGKYNYGNATFTVVPSITIISPVSAAGVAGSTVTISGSAFAANSSLTATFGGAPVTINGVSSTNSTGQFVNATFTVPSQTGGSKTITFSDSAIPTQNTASTTFTLNPTISISSSTGAVGSTITLSGSNFAASSKITVKYDGTTLTTSPVTITTTSSGAIPSGVTFTIPASTAGTHAITVTDASTNVGSATYTVNPTITLNPTSGNVGTSILVSGTGFASSSTITITYDGAVQIYPTSNSVGSFSASFVAPASSSGAHTIQATDGTNTGTATFTIASLIVLNPSSGIVSSTVSVSGSGFTANAQVTVTFGGSTIATTPTPVITGSTGSFSASFIVPAGSITGSIAGSKTIQATDGANTASAIFSVIPAVTVNPTSENVGSTITVSGTGYASLSQITIKYDGTTQTTSPGTVTSTNYGAFSCTFLAPPSVAGLHTVSTTDASTNTAAVTCTIVPSITLNPTSGGYGSTDTISGGGFAASKTITATFNGVSITLGGTTTTGATGSFTGATFTVPISTIGAQTIVVTDANSNSASTIFTATPAIILPALGESGTSISVTGYAFAPNSALKATFNGSPLTLTGTTTTSATGSFSGSTFIVPTISTGPETVVFSDSATPTPNAAQATFTVTVAITITSSQAGAGYIQVDGVAVTTPIIFHWLTGNSHTISAQSPVSGGTGKQYVYTSWSDTGAQSHTYAVPSSSATVTASYKTQYLQTFAGSGLAGDATGNLVTFTVSGGSYSGATSPIGISGGSIWVDNGATVTYAFVNPVTSSVTGKQYRLNSVTGSASPITVSGANTLTGNYVVQWQVTFASSGSGTTNPSGTNVWENTGSLSISATPGTNYHFSSWSATTGITITSSTSASTTATIGASGTITANFGLNPAIDGSGTGSATSGTTFTISAFSTSNTNDLIYVSVTSYNRYVSSISGTGGLTFACRQSAGNTLTWSYSSNNYYISTWYVVKPSTGSITITVTMSGSITSAAAVAYGISNVNTVSPFDGAYATGTGTGTSATAAKTTSNPNDMIIGAAGVSSGTSSSPALTVGSGFTSVNTATQNSGSYRVETSAEYQILTAPQTNFAVGYTWSGSYGWTMVADAIQPAS